MGVPVWTVIWRTCLGFGALLVATRLVGRRQLSQFTVGDFVSALAAGTMAVHVGFEVEKPAGLYILTLGIWMSITFLIDFVTARSRGFRVLVDGAPIVVVEHGRLLEERLRKLKCSPDELMSMLRQDGYFDMNDVAFVIMEPNGKLSVMQKRQKLPLTPADLAIPVPGRQGISVTLVVDGQIRERNLRLAGLDRAWLADQLQRKAVPLAEVAFAHLDSSGQLYVDLKDDPPAPGPDATPEWVPPPDPHH